MENHTQSPNAELQTDTIEMNDVDILETISKALGVPDGHFVDNRTIIINVGGHLVSGSGNMVRGDVCCTSSSAELEKAKLENRELKKQIDYLQQIIIEKERTISALMPSE